MEQEDAHAAHYTAWLMQPHTKKSVKPDKIRRIKPDKQEKGTKQGDELAPRRARKATREELIESVNKMPKKTRPKR